MRAETILRQREGMFAPWKQCICDTMIALTSSFCSVTYPQSSVAVDRQDLLQSETRFNMIQGTYVGAGNDSLNLFPGPFINDVCSETWNIISDRLRECDSDKGMGRSKKIP